MIAIFFGSGLGGIARYVMGRFIEHERYGLFPAGTFFVNLLACLALGSIIGFASQKHVISEPTKLFLTVGFCGGFSTFSSFSRETLSLIHQGQFTIAAIYVFGSILICLAATFAGLYVGHHFS
ncbi:MAG: fluoride efflux transporter CrcB [Bacteroidia bacterium]|nr:fluoride efflux transporter CrcB [Bacteroidia bacterium]